MRVLRYQSISRNKIAIAELADLVVQYERLEKDEEAGRLNEAKRRELGLKKVALYDKYNISLFMLSVPKSKMPEYLAFWPNFWRRVDEFKKANPEIRGPGPFTLPREGRLAGITNGVQSLAKSLGENLAVKEAVADYYYSSSYPRCGDHVFSLRVPVKPCDNYDEELFYYKLIIGTNAEFFKDDEYNMELTGPRSSVVEEYADDYECVWDSRRKKHVRKGHIFRRMKKETEWCGSDSGDAQGNQSKVTEWDDVKKKGTMKFIRPCLDSKHKDFEGEKEEWAKKGKKLDEEPEWCDFR